MIDCRREKSVMDEIELDTDERITLLYSIVRYCVFIFLLMLVVLLVDRYHPKDSKLSAIDSHSWPDKK